jgi:RNA recognition motif-containing protein
MPATTHIVQFVLAVCVSQVEWNLRMAKKLFCGGLSWDTTDDSLRQAFEQFGEVVDAKVIMDRETGRSKGFGFVTLANDSEATAAISGMDGKSLDGRNIRVNEAIDKPRPSGGDHGGGRGGSGGGRGGSGGGGRW